LEKSYGQVIEEEARAQRRKTLKQAADEFLVDYKLKHESATFAVYALGHVTDHLGGRLVVEITPTVVKRYQTDRLAEKAGPKTINDEVLLLLRLCGDQGDLIRAKLRREKAMKLALPPSPGRAYTADEKTRMLAEAAKLRSKNMYPALVVDLNCGLRDKELRELRWRQVDLVHKKHLTVGKSKTDAGTGRVIPLKPRSWSPSKRMRLGTSGGSVSAGQSGMSSLPGRGSRMIRPARLQHYGPRGQRCATKRTSSGGGMTTATRWSLSSLNPAPATK